MCRPSTYCCSAPVLGSARHVRWPRRVLPFVISETAWLATPDGYVGTTSLAPLVAWSATMLPPLRFPYMTYLTVFRRFTVSFLHHRVRPVLPCITSLTCPTTFTRASSRPLTPFRFLLGPEASNLVGECRMVRPDQPHVGRSLGREVR